MSLFRRKAMSSKFFCKKDARRAFTLVEVLIALAIAGLVMTAATSLLVTISKAWADRPATRDAFDAHVNGVGRFLAALMDKATMPPGSSAQGGPIRLDRPVGFSDADDPLISFFVREAPPLLVWPRGLAPRVHCYLFFEDGEGLSLLWYSDLQEMERGEDGKPVLEDEDDLFKTPISTLCEEITYCYYGEEGAAADDFKEWEKETDLEENAENGSFRLPAFIQLRFRHAEEDLERVVTIPVERISPNGLSAEKR